MLENKNEKSLGFILKEARTTKNITMEQASKYTKIHPNILKSLENDDYGSLGAVYAKSFLKIYAEYLGLDKEDIVRRFQETIKPEEASSARKIRFPDDEEIPWYRKFHAAYGTKVLNVAKKVDFKLAGVAALALLLLLFSARSIRHRKTVARVRKTAQTAQVKLDHAPPPVRPEPPAAKKSTPVAVPSVSTTPPAEIPKSEAVKEAPAADKKKEKIVLVIRAKINTWLQVKVDGKIVFQSILRKGTADTWQAAEKIELWVGNAGAVQLEINGRLFDKIGRPGQTLKHVVVTRAGLSIKE